MLFLTPLYCSIYAMSILRIYTDGACSGNQNEENIGGWGAILEFGSHRKELCGGEINTTNNRMEMTALLEALKAIKKPGQTIEVFSDSSYLMNCFREGWYKKWMKNGWMNSKKEPVENREIWEELIPFLDEHSFSFYRVKGHVSIAWHLTQGPDQADKEARAQILEAVNGMAEYPAVSPNDDTRSLSGAAVNSKESPLVALNLLPEFLKKHYRSFTEWNGDRFTPAEFLYVTRMNNRADALANEGMDAYR